MARAMANESKERAGDAVPIDSLPLSNRTRARLREAGIETAAELAGRSDDDLLQLRGFGHTCLREVRSVLRVLGSDASAATITTGDESFPGVTSEPLLATPLANLPISNRARGVFAREMVRTVADFIDLGPQRLLTLRNFGETTLAAVNRAIHAAERALQGSGNSDRQPFQAPEMLASNPQLESGLARVPVAALDLPRRARRACQELGLRTLRDLTRISTSDLLVRRNFGQATLRRIQNEMERFLRDYEESSPDEFCGILHGLLSRLQPKERRLIEYREGRDDDEPLTLTEAGRAMDITESRACQIEHSAWAKLRRFSAGVTDAAADNAVRVLMRHGGVAEPTALLDDPYFAGGSLRPGFLARMLARLLPHRLARLADGRLAAVPAATLYTLAARLRKRLRRSNQSLPLHHLAQEVLRGLELGEERVALIQALCEVLFAREVAAGPDGEILVRTPSQGLSDDLRQILLDSGKPLHFTEIARQLALPPYLRTDLTEEKVRLRLCRDRRFVLVRRGLYDLRERFSVRPSLKRALADSALAILRRAGRPTSVALLGAELRESPQFSEISEFVLAAVLREDSRFTHLGRGTFVPADSNSTSVLHVSQILELVLTKAGGPLTYAELRRRVQERRQVSDGAISATLVGRGTFLRIARGVFDLAERYPFDDQRRAQLATRSRELVEAAGGILSLRALSRQLEDVGEGLKRGSTPVLIGDILRRVGGFQFLGGGFICLADGSLENNLADRAFRALENTREPLRPTTVARRLGLGEGAVQLLRKVLRDDRRFIPHPDGRYGV